MIKFYEPKSWSLFFSAASFFSFLIRHWAFVNTEYIWTLWQFFVIDIYLSIRFSGGDPWHAHATKTHQNLIDSLLVFCCLYRLLPAGSFVIIRLWCSKTIVFVQVCIYFKCLPEATNTQSTITATKSQINVENEFIWAHEAPILIVPKWLLCTSFVPLKVLFDRKRAERCGWWSRAP